ncbi:hypothetical protein GGR92_000419 [Spirosoma lacussanchae]|uniref:DUF5916 domain-containing protein n=1 Tax=Spirosoma lacussanchae TaxID=1884249 RepID=UPI001FE463EB|nr:DUF5916 domain-containing protein [Spirosoma lacussanchae]
MFFRSSKQGVGPWMIVQNKLAYRLLCKTRTAWTVFVAVLLHSVALSQSLLVSPTDTLVRLDGELTESVWQRAAVAGQFTQNFPNDTLPALNRTEVRLTYDQNNLYVGVVCFDQNRNKRFVASSLRRDWEWDLNDNFTLYIDPFGDRTNGFTFNVTPLGVEREGQLFNGERVATEWDNKWRSFVKVYPDRWQAELMIPFKSIRYRQNSNWFLMNFARHDLKNNQRASWRRVPIAYRISALAFADTVRFSTPLPRVGTNISLIPYVSGRIDDYRGEGGAYKPGSNAGFDAKVAVTPALNLDLTVNPDFSQVEVDQQVTNLDRFEIFFPERRQFFLENNDLFANLGFEQSRPFFSRRIGIGRDTSTGVTVQNPILYGLRLSGKVDKNWRIGLLNTQTARQSSRGISPQNYTVGVVQRQVLGRSNLVGFFINRDASSVTPGLSRYTRIGGVEFNLLTADNRWAGKVWGHKAFQEGQAVNTTQDAAHGLLLTYTSRNLMLEWSHEYIGARYNINDVGYVARRGQWGFFPKGGYTFYSRQQGGLVSHGPGFETRFYRDLTGRLLDRELNLFYSFALRNTTEFGGGFYSYYTYLFSAFDPTNLDGKALPAGTDYRIKGGFWFLNTDRRKLLTLQVEGWTGGYFNGTNFNVAPTLNYRFQPYGSFGITAEHNNIRLPAPYSSASFWLVGPRLDLTFSRRVFLTTFAQFNNQTNNTLLNTRLQWRYAPVSDLFVVYQENYVPGSFQSKNRTLVLKLSYWLNL